MTQSPRRRPQIYWEVIVLTVLALITRLWTIARPGDTVFDEVYFKDFASRYFTGHYYFDIHPPLGKLLLAGWAHLWGLGGSTLVNTSAWQVRLLPALAGALLVPVIYGIVRRLGGTRIIATLAAGAILLDNALTVESRFVLVDSLLLLFGFSAIYFALIAAGANRRRWAWWILAALAAGAAGSTKWTGLTALAMVGLIWLKSAVDRHSWRGVGQELAILIIVPVAVYLSAFWVHFQLLPLSGSGDAFMSTQFQSTLKGNPLYEPSARMSFWAKTVELNREMYHASATLTATHPYASPWYKWPLELRPIYYWEGPVLANGTQGNIYLLGNPFVWWPAALGLIVGAVGWVIPRVKSRLQRHAPVLGLLAVGYLANFLPFMGINRVMFLYHYFFAFVFSVMLSALLLDALLPDAPAGTVWYRRPRVIVPVALLVLALIGFAYFAPLTYGTPLSPPGLHARDWLSSWR